MTWGLPKPGNSGWIIYAGKTSIDVSKGRTQPIGKDGMFFPEIVRLKVKRFLKNPENLWKNYSGAFSSSPLWNWWPVLVGSNEWQTKSGLKKSTGLRHILRHEENSAAWGEVEKQREEDDMKITEDAWKSKWVIKRCNSWIYVYDLHKHDNMCISLYIYIYIHWLVAWYS